jgi:hypothetical protein
VTKSVPFSRECDAKECRKQAIREGEKLNFRNKILLLVFLKNNINSPSMEIYFLRKITAKDVPKNSLFPFLNV